MHAVRLAPCVIVLVVASVAPAQATGCSRCSFYGDCGEARIPCLPSEARCVPNGGILVFNSYPPNVPAYWTLYARRKSPPGRLVGKLKVWADRETAPPSVPGFPGRCDRRGCLGRTARFDGSMTGDRLNGVARYPGGGSCEFSMTIAWGFGEPEPNAFVCRSASGEILSQGAIQLQGIRLSGCQQ